MFGYVRPFKPYMRMFEYDIYKAVYCGLCKDMGREYGVFTRFTLSYDFAFLSLVDLSIRGVKLDTKNQICIAHPFKKTMCACCGNDFSYSSANAIILTYHKLRDDIADKGLKGKILAVLTIPFFRKPYKKASSKFPMIAPKIEGAMDLQKKIEREKCAGIDMACEPTAQMMSVVFGGLCDKDEDKEKFQLLERFGYLLGRFIYISDALDDLEDDYKKGSYNPLLVMNKVENGLDGIPKKILEKIYTYADDSVNFTLGELAEIYVKIDFKRYRDILDNIVYLGLKNVYNSLRNGTFNKKQKKGNHEK